MSDRTEPPVRAVQAIAVLTVVQLTLAAIGLGWWGWRTFAYNELEGTPPELAADAPRPVDLESAYPLALARAQGWDQDAKLILVSAQIDWPLEAPPDSVSEPPGGGWLTYVFLNPGNGGDRALCLLIERYSGRIMQEIVAPWGAPGTIAELDLLGLSVSSSDALLAAEAAGGTDFRRVCPEARHQTRISLGQAPLNLSANHTEIVQGASPTADATPAAGFPATSSATSTAADASWLLGYRDVRDNGIAPLQFGVDVQTGATVAQERSVAEVEGCPT